MLTLDKVRTVPSWYVPSRRLPPNFQPSRAPVYLGMNICGPAGERGRCFTQWQHVGLKRIAIARLVFPARNRQAHLPAPSFCWNILVFCYKGVASFATGMSHNLWHVVLWVWECTGLVSCNKGTVRNSDQREGRVEVERELRVYGYFCPCRLRRGWDQWGEG
jgi:hypothetical protein